MPTLDYLTGFNHRLASLDATSSGTATTIDTSTVRRAGGSSLKFSTTNATSFSKYSVAASKRFICAVCYINFSTIAAVNTRQLLTVSDSAVSNFTNYVGIGQATNGDIQRITGSGVTGTTFTPSTGIWYRLELKVDTSANPWSYQAGVAIADGSLTDLSTGTLAVAAADIAVVTLGWNSSNTQTCFITDYAWSTQSTDYPIGPIAVLGYSPNAVGTHNLDASTSTFFFTETQAPPGGTTTALTTSETTSYQSIDDIAIDTGTDAVKVIASIGSPNTPTFRSAGTWAFSANNVSNGALSPGAPSGKAVGDLLLLIATSTSNTFTITTPSGWNVCTNFPKASGTSLGGKIYALTRIADGTASDTPSVTFAGLTTGTSGTPGGVGILAFTNLTETQDATAVLQDLATQTTTSSITGITTATNNSMVINMALKILESSGQTATVTTYTENSDNSTTSGSGYINENSHLVKTTAGASGSGTITWSATTSARALIATIALKATAPITQPTNTWYAEYDFGNVASQISASSNPYAIRAIVAQELDTAVSSTWAAKLYDAIQGTNTEDIINSSISTTTKTYVGKTFSAKPKGVDLSSDPSATVQQNVGQTTDSLLAQSFTADGSTPFIAVSVPVQKQNGPTDNLQLTLQSDSSGSPSGTVLATSLTTLSGSALTTSLVVQTFFFTPINLTNGTKYWLVWSRTGALNDTNFYQLGSFGDDTHYSGETGKVFGSSWSALSVDLGVSLSYSWNLSIFNAVRLRFGYTAAASGHPRLAATMLEAAFKTPNSFLPDTRRVSRNILLRR